MDHEGLADGRVIVDFRESGSSRHGCCLQLYAPRRFEKGVDAMRGFDGLTLGSAPQSQLHAIA